MAPHWLIATALMAGLGLGYSKLASPNRVIESVIATHPNSEPQVSAALADPGRLDRVAALASSLANIPPEGLDGVLAAFEQAPLAGGDIEYVLLVAWWAGFDPEATNRWVRRDLGVGGHRLILEEMLRTWAVRDPKRALEVAAREMQFPTHTRSSITAVLLGANTSEPLAALELLDTLPPSRDRQAAIAEFFSRRAANTEPAPAKRWIEDLVLLADQRTDTGIAELAEEIQSAAVITLAERDPAGAANWWSARNDNLPIPDALAEKIGLAWAERDPRTALGWVSTLPAGAFRDELVQDLYREWKIDDLRAALEWIAPQAEGAERWLEPAVRSYAITVGAEDPHNGLAIAQRLNDPEIQREATMAILGPWLRRDSVAATAWIETANLPPEQKHKLISQARPTAPPNPAQARPPSS